jgi:hypothetical protein
MLMMYKSLAETINNVPTRPCIDECVFTTNSVHDEEEVHPRRRRSSSTQISPGRIEMRCGYHSP